MSSTQSETVFRQLTLMTRKKGTTQAEFKKHWETTHAEVALGLPVFRETVLRYEQLYPLPGEDKIEMPGGVQCDGVVILDFKTLEDREKLLASAEYKEAVHGDSIKFAELAEVKRVLVQRRVFHGI